MMKDFIAEPIQFIGKLLSNVAGFDQGWKSGDARGFGPAEVFEFVSRWVLLEDIGADDFWVKFPDCIEAPRVVGAVEL